MQTKINNPSAIAIKIKCAESDKENGTDFLTEVDRQHKRPLELLQLKEPMCYYDNTLPKAMTGEIKDSFWEFQHSPLGEKYPMISPFKLTRKIQRTGSKRDKIKRDTTHIAMPQISYAIHGLKQYRDRSGGKRVDFDALHNVNSQWIDAMIALDDLEISEDEAIKMSTKGGGFLPFGKGAFIGDVALFRGGTDVIDITYRKGVPRTSFAPAEVKAHFIAVTYISINQFFPHQLRTFQLINLGRYEEAIENIKATHINRGRK